MGWTIAVIRTPDQRLRVFISSTLKEMREERNTAREAVGKLRLTPVLFEQGARPYPPRALYQAYLEQSHVFVGIYGVQYGWVAPDMEMSGLEDEYRLAADKPRLIYVLEPAPARDPRLTRLLDQIKKDGRTSYKAFRSTSELGALVEEDLALLLSERFEGPRLEAKAAVGIPRPRVASVPVPASRFIGREKEVRAVADLLRQGDTRVVTLTGLGGIGKSRLALKVAGEVRERFADGVTFVPLDGVMAAAMVMPAAAQALGLRDLPGRTPLEVVEDYLGAREMLLVLDGFEHVVEAVPMVAELLERCERLKVLVTSREVLRVSGEHLFDVPPLSLPEDPGLATATIAKSEAVRLFLDRARAVKEGFELNDKTAPTIAKIVRRLEGLPLAIELAAARVRLLPLEAILQRLESRLGLLTGGPRNLPERQRTLRNAIDWSYRLLSEGDRALLARLSVFVGGWTLEAMGVVCVPEGTDPVEALSSMIDKSLVRPGGFAGDEPWFTMLELVREYALEHLDDRGEVELRSNLHAEYYLALAERGTPDPTTGSREQWLERFAAESGNIRAAMAWLLKQVPPTRTARMGWALWNCWWLRSHLSEAVPWMEEVQASGEALSPGDRARAAYLLGVSAFGLGDRGRALSNLQMAHTLFRDLGDRHGAATALSALGTAVAQTLDLVQGEEMVRQALATFRELRDARATTETAVFGLGWVLMMQGRNAEAVPLLEESVGWARDAGEKMMLTTALTYLGWAHLGAGDYPHAKASLLESLKVADDLGDVSRIAWLLEAFAALALGLGDPKGGALLFGAAEGGRRSMGAETWAPELLRRETTRKALQGALGDEELAAKFAEGTRMSPQDALKLAAALR